MKVDLSKEKDKISSMFDSIAPKYDLLNHTLSMNFDRIWRRKLIKVVLKGGPKLVLDLACGTGDVSFGLATKAKDKDKDKCKKLKVIGGDLSREMLKIAFQKKEKLVSKQKISPDSIDFQYCEADQLPFEDNSFDAITISFGIRNFEQREKCIQELYRVLRKGGQLAIIEFSTPKNIIWKAVYTTYFKHILPFIGRIVSGTKTPYSYLPASAMDFPQREVFCKEFSDAGFSEAKYQSLTGGVACLYTAIK